MSDEWRMLKEGDEIEILGHVVGCWDPGIRVRVYRPKDSQLLYVNCPYGAHMVSEIGDVGWRKITEESPIEKYIRRELYSNEPTST